MANKYGHTKLNLKWIWLNNDDKKGAISILNKSRYSIFGYLNPSSTIVDLHKKYEPDKIDSILEK